MKKKSITFSFIILKLILLVEFLCIIDINQVFGVSFEYSHVASAEKTSSFDVFAGDADTFVMPMYFRDSCKSDLFASGKNLNENLMTSELNNDNAGASEPYDLSKLPALSYVPKVTSYTGIAENKLNMGFSTGYKDFYGSFTFWEKIANYGDWPFNHTELGLSGMAGFNTWAVQARYLDFCYGKGAGYIAPGIALSKLFFTDSTYKLRSEFSNDWFFRYWKANMIDAWLPVFTVKFDYSKNYSNGLGISYSYIPSICGPANHTDLSEVYDSHKLTAWVGADCNLDDKITAGIRPNGFVTFNAANPTKSVNNYYGEYGNFEAHIVLPFSIKYNYDDKLQFVTSLMFGLYYASFDHLKYDGIGGSNPAGWVNETGLAIGVNVAASPRCTIRFGSNFVRINEANQETLDTNETTDSENISASNIAAAPLSVTIQLKF